MKIYFRILIASALLLWGFTQIVSASCMVPLSPPEELERADAVFVGTVTNIKTPLLDQTNNLVTFRVSKSWKGESAQETTLQVPRPDRISIGLDLMPGEEYLVYAHSEEGQLSTNICSRTKPLSEAQDEIETLDSLNLQPQVKIGRPTSSDDFVLGSLELKNISLLINVTYGGGCKEHKFELYQKETYLRNFEPVELYLTHESNSDSCEALITKPLAFDISSILEKNPVEITVHGTNGNSIEIERHVNITDTPELPVISEKDPFLQRLFSIIQDLFD